MNRGNLIAGLLLAGALAFLALVYFRRRAADAGGATAGGSRGSALGTLLCGGALAQSSIHTAMPLCPAVGEELAPIVGASVDQATGIVNAVGGGIADTAAASWGATSGVISAGGRLASGLISIPTEVVNANVKFVKSVGNTASSLVSAPAKFIGGLFG